MTFQLLSFNMENFFLTSQSLEPSRGLVQIKEKSKVELIAKMINEISPDVCALSEVGGFDSLKFFSENYLSNEYLPICPPGNSDRGIEVGYLIRRKSSFNFHHISHTDKVLDFMYPNDILENRKAKERGLEEPHGLQHFSRDVSELQIEFTKGEPSLIIFLVHFKSQWDRRGDDFRGVGHRKAEVKGLIEIAEERKNEFPNSHLILTGDFNGRVKGEKTDGEFDLIRENNWIDILEAKNLPPAEKYSMIQFNQGVKELVQLDYILFQPRTTKLIDLNASGLIRFKDKLGNQIPIPRSLTDRSLLPSDHYPLLLSLHLQV